VGVRCLRRVWGVTRSDDGYFGGVGWSGDGYFGGVTRSDDGYFGERLLALCLSLKMGGAMMGTFFGGGRGG
jgi:hypothetical protein